MRLNLAQPGDLSDTAGDGIAQTTFADALRAAAAVRLDQTFTHDWLEAQRDILEQINLIEQS